MSRKNKKHVQLGGRTVGISAVLGVCLMCVGMLYLWVNQSCFELGQDIKRLEREQLELNKKIMNEERNWASSKSMPNMERLFAKHAIKMGFPEEKNIIRISRNPPDETYASRLTSKSQ